MKDLRALIENYARSRDSKMLQALSKEIAATGTAGLHTLMEHLGDRGLEEAHTHTINDQSALELITAIVSSTSPNKSRMLSHVREIFEDDSRSGRERLLSLQTLRAFNKKLDTNALCNLAIRLDLSALLRAECLASISPDDLPLDRAQWMTVVLENPPREVAMQALPLAEHLSKRELNWKSLRPLLLKMEELVGHEDEKVRILALKSIRGAAGIDSIERLRMFPPRIYTRPVREGLTDLVGSIIDRPMNLLTLSPEGFEHLTKRLLVSLGCTHVEVTGRTGDNGIDVTGSLPGGVCLSC